MLLEFRFLFDRIPPFSKVALDHRCTAEGGCLSDWYSGPCILRPPEDIMVLKFEGGLKMEGYIYIGSELCHWYSILKMEEGIIKLRGLNHKD